MFSVECLMISDELLILFVFFVISDKTQNSKHYLLFICNQYDITLQFNSNFFPF